MSLSEAKEIRTRADLEADELNKHRRKRDYNNDYDDSTGVVNCPSLKVRMEPDKNSEVVGILSEGDIVYTEKIPNNKEWLSVFTVYGTSGYCMKQFISKYGE